MRRTSNAKFRKVNKGKKIEICPRTRIPIIGHRTFAFETEGRIEKTNIFENAKLANIAQK